MISLLDQLESHYRKYLGVPTKAVIDKSTTGKDLSIKVLKYDHIPTPDAVALITLGLSSAQSHSFKEELIFLSYAKFANGDITDLIISVAREVASSYHPLTRGEVLQLGKVIPDTQISALFIYPPVYLPDGFEPVTLHDNSLVHVAWLVPICRTEDVWIKEHGYEAFVDVLQIRDPDLLNLARHPIEYDRKQ